MTNSIALTLAPHEATFVLLGLRLVQKHLNDSMGDDAGGEFNDLIVLGHLIESVEAAEKQSKSDTSEPTGN